MSESLESYMLGTKVLLAQLLHKSKNNRYWHYGLTLPSSNPNSLSSYLDMTYHEYKTLLITLALASYQKEGGADTFSMKYHAWETFLEEKKLNTNVYFDKYKTSMNNIDDEGKMKPIRYQGYWIGVGKYMKK